MSDRVSEATRVSTEWWLNNDGHIESIKVVVTLKTGSPSFYHPLDFAKAARLFEENTNKVAEESASAFGPYKNDIDFGV